MAVGKLSPLRSFWLGLGLLGLNAPLPPAYAALFERPSIDLQAEARAAAAEGKQLAVFLTLPDCPGCLEMERTVYRDKAVEAGFARKFRSVRLDISETGKITDPAGNSTSPNDFARRLRALATPSFAFFDGRGQVLYRYTGTLDSDGFRHLTDFVSRGDYERHPFMPPKRNRAGKAVEGAAHASKVLFADPPGATLPLHPDFVLGATDGREHRPADFRGLAIALAVGYTQCPDVCPTTLAELKAAVEALPANIRPQVQVLFATLDPERDSLAILGEYANAFRPIGGRPILGLRGNPEQTTTLIRQLQLVAEKQPSASMGYTLDHTAGIFLFDAQGRLLGLSPYGQPLEKLTRDLSTIATQSLAQR